MDIADAAQDAEARARSAAIAAALQRPHDPGPEWIDGQACCRECEEPIPAPRLAALPGVGLSVVCAAEDATCKV